MNDHSVRRFTTNLILWRYHLDSRCHSQNVARNGRQILTVCTGLSWAMGSTIRQSRDTALVYQRPFDMAKHRPWTRNGQFCMKLRRRIARRASSQCTYNEPQCIRPTCNTVTGPKCTSLLFRSQRWGGRKVQLPSGTPPCHSCSAFELWLPKGSLIAGALQLAQSAARKQSGRFV